MFDASHDAGCQETSLGRHKRPSRKGTTPQHTLDIIIIIIIIIINNNNNITCILIII